MTYAVTQERRGAASSATLPELMGHVTTTGTSSVKQVNYVNQVTVEAVGWTSQILSEASDGSSISCTVALVRVARRSVAKLI